MATAAPETPKAAAASITVDGRSLSLEDVARVARLRAPVSVSADPAVLAGINASLELNRELMDARLPIYGVTTGFGDSVRRQISPEQAARLQARMIRYHGNGTGATATVDTARAVMVIRANCLMRGHSAVRPELIQRLLEYLNRGITPVIPEEGSVGASGDLVPLSYVAAALVGERDVMLDGTVRPAREALREIGLEPLMLQPKEGLALLNGTAFMAGIGALATVDACRLARIADACTAMTTEVLSGISGPFDPFIHDIAKPHPGQVRSAANVRWLLEGSHLARPYESVVQQVGAIDGQYRELQVSIQDKYSVRCAPHFIGVLWDTLEWVGRWLEVEINSSNDNPLYDVSQGRVLSGGNFSGGHVGLAMDALKIAVASVGDLLDRQLELIVDEKFNQGLTPNLIPILPDGHPDLGLNHGFKGMQLACSSLAAEALNRCMPMTAFSRSTECHNQDKVSMGATAARQARDVVGLVEKVAAVHLIALCQAADLRGPENLGRTREVYARIRSRVPALDEDREMQADIEAVLDMLHDGSLTASW
jgi:histidine ammonia-lyase/phenylalanine ammonia-lyase